MIDFKHRTRFFFLHFARINGAKIQEMEISKSSLTALQNMEIMVFYYETFYNVGIR